MLKYNHSHLILKNTLPDVCKISGFMRIGLASNFKLKKVIMTFNNSNDIGEKLLHDKEDITMHYSYGAELINFGTLKDNNWSSIMYWLDKKDKYYLESLINYKIYSYDIIAWRKDYHKVFYDPYNDKFRLMRYI